MKPQKRFWYLLLIVTIFVMSCDVSTLAAPQPIPTSAPDVINMIVAQTAAAALTQTAALIPPTRTPTFTPFPTKTASVTPSPTVTFIFRLPTKTRTPLPTKTRVSTTGGGGGGGGGGTTKSWSCSLISQYPNNNTEMTVGSVFNATWTVKNTSTLAWDLNSVDEIFTGGINLSAKSLYDLPSTVGVGSTYVISIPMATPSTPGTYLTNWSLTINNNQFCPLSLSILGVP